MAAPPSTRGAPATRRFIYLIMEGGDNTHTLHRIDTRPLFAQGERARHGPEAAQRFAAGKRGRRGSPAAQPAAGAAPTLPHPLARFDCAIGRQFFALGSGVEKIVSVDRNRHTVIFDTRTDSVRAGPDARHDKWHPRGTPWPEAGGRLYHLGRAPGFEDQVCLDFEVLTYDEYREDWFWNMLPPPPFERFSKVTIDSFADAGAASTIRISAWNSTYAFDAARGSWREEGDWALPFHGRAQYVADYGLWFGFTDRLESDLCAVDLDVAGRPVRRHVWADVDGHANDGNGLQFSYLSYLGNGRFCVTRFFRMMDNNDRRIMAAIVTAVKATPTRAAAVSATGEMRMVKRASVLYISPEWRLPCWAY